MEENRNRSRRQLLFVHGLCGRRREKSGHTSNPRRYGLGIRVRAADTRYKSRSRQLQSYSSAVRHRTAAAAAPAGVRSRIRFRTSRSGPHAQRIGPVGSRGALSGRGFERYGIRILLYELPQPPPGRERHHRQPRRLAGGSCSGQCGFCPQFRDSRGSDSGGDRCGDRAGYGSSNPGSDCGGNCESDCRSESGPCR